MNLLEKVDKYLENPYLERTHRTSTAHYPSQSSCLVKNEYNENIIIGNCMRSIYWESRGIKKTNPMKARGARITRVGKIVEQFEIDRYKELGIWRGNNVKFFNEKYKISGEIDALVFNEEARCLIGVEIKTGYDYKFRKEVIGTPTKKGKPKLEHLLQTMLYIDYFKLLFKIVYIDRGNAARKEYDITINKDGTPNIDGKKLDNGLSIPGCIARFKQLEEHLEDSTLPRRDFQLQYSPQQVEFLYDSNRLNKAQKKEFEKNKKVDMGDWRCRYCDYKDYCWEKTK